MASAHTNAGTRRRPAGSTWDRGGVVWAEVAMAGAWRPPRRWRLRAALGMGTPGRRRRAGTSLRGRGTSTPSRRIRAPNLPGWEGNPSTSGIAGSQPTLDHCAFGLWSRKGDETVIIQLRSIGRAEPDDLAAILPTLSEAAAAVDLDHSRLAVVLDWVQYRKNFRAPVMVRPFVGSLRDGRSDEPLAEIAIDVRRAGATDRATLRTEIVDRLSKALGIMPDVHECTHLEDWVRPSKSVTWSFNRSYWRHLGAWDETFQKDYASALPGGVSDGTSPAFWADRIDAFMATLNRLEEWSELPDEIHVLELGVGDGQGAKVWLDAFAAACEEQGPDYLARVRYLMADYSPHVLARARERVGEYADLVRCLELDFCNPMSALSELRGKLLFAHTCNVYDNLPTDEVMRVGDHAYEPLVRASITPAEMADLSARHGIAQDEIVAVAQRVLREGPECLGDLAAGVRFWADVWEAVHLEEI